MSSDNVLWHFYLGYLVLGLLVFRIVWGVFGPVPAQFKSLKPAPTALLKYVKTLHRRAPSGVAGHNPLGALWVIAMLLLLTAQGITGLFIEADDLFEYGPLFDYVSEHTAKLINGWHYRLSNIVLAMVALHVSVLVLYLLWKKENLIGPMINGWKWVRRDKTDS